MLNRKYKKTKKLKKVIYTFLPWAFLIVFCFQNLNVASDFKNIHVVFQTFFVIMLTM